MSSATLALLLLALPAADPPRTLTDRITPLVKAHRGRAAVAVKHLETGEAWALEGDAVMPTASLIKLPVLVELYLQADEDRLKLTDRVTLREADKVPGSGLLSYHFSEGANFSLRDAARLMTAVSDNTATNLVIDRVGIAAVNARMASWGLKETRLNAKVFRGSVSSVDPARTAKYGLGSTTAGEMVTLLDRVVTGDALRPALKQAVLGHLSKNDDTQKFKRLLPPGVRVAHKDGAVSDARTDAGVLFTPGGAVALCVLTAGNEDRRWVDDNAGNLLCARVARAVHDHFNAK